MKLLLIHGSVNYIQKHNTMFWHKSKWMSILRKPITKKLFGKISKPYMDEFESFLKEQKYNVEQFKWSGSILLSDIKEEAKKLHRELKKDENVLLIAKSNGGLLAQYALLGLDHKLIQIATPNINPKTNLHIINIYSNSDKIQKAGIKYYQLISGHFGSRKMYGNYVRNIAMDGLSHEDFNKEEKFFVYKDLINKIIHEN